MTRPEYIRFLAGYWVYTIVWIAVALAIAFFPGVPTMLRWILALLLAVGTPAGGQFTGYESYLRWAHEHVLAEDVSSTTNGETP